MVTEARQLCAAAGWSVVLKSSKETAFTADENLGQTRSLCAGAGWYVVPRSSKDIEYKIKQGQ